MDIDEESQEFTITNKEFSKQYMKNHSGKYRKRVYLQIFLVFIFIIIILFFIIFIKNRNKRTQQFSDNKSKINNITDINKIKNIDLIPITNISSNNLNITYNKTINNDDTNKIGIAFVYSNLFSNGVARFITLTAEYFLQTGKYDIYFITANPYHKEYNFSKKIKRFIGENNLNIISNITKYYKIDFFILNNVISSSTIKWYKLLGSKIIGIFHGNFMSSMFLNDALIYKSWHQFDNFDAYIFLAADDYYFYNSLNFKNHIFIPNLYTFEPSKMNNSNLTYHNIMMLGRQNDKMKGAIYAIKAMDLIVKEIPDAKLNIITSDSRIEFLKNLTIELNLSQYINFIYHTYDISSYFYNSSILLYTSLSEAFPMAMNEGKAHGMPIVAFEVPISLPYQNGVINVESLNYTALAKECIRLLKDYNYRRKMGEWSKLSLDKFSNNETVEIWGKLFESLIEGEDKYRELQKEIENKFYNEDIAKLHIEKHFRDMQKYNSNFSCYTLENFTNQVYIKNIKICSEINN